MTGQEARAARKVTHKRKKPQRPREFVEWGWASSSGELGTLVARARFRLHLPRALSGNFRFLATSWQRAPHPTSHHTPIRIKSIVHLTLHVNPKSSVLTHSTSR